MAKLEGISCSITRPTSDIKSDLFPIRRKGISFQTNINVLSIYKGAGKALKKEDFPSFVALTELSNVKGIEIEVWDVIAIL